MASSSLASTLRRRALPTLRQLSPKQQQKRAHHPDPFNPKSTRGWKAALKVRLQDSHYDCFYRKIQLLSSATTLIFWNLFLIHYVISFRLRKQRFLRHVQMLRSNIISTLVCQELAPFRTRPFPPFLVANYLILQESTPF